MLITGQDRSARGFGADGIAVRSLLGAGLPLALVTAAALIYEAILFQNFSVEPAAPLGVMRGIAEIFAPSLQHGMVTWLLGVMLTSVAPLVLLGSLIAERAGPDATGSKAGHRIVVRRAVHHLVPVLVIGGLILGGRDAVDPAMLTAIWLVATGAGLAAALGMRHRRRPWALLPALARNAAAFGGMLIAAAAAGLILASLERSALPIDVAQFLAGAAGERAWPLVLLTLIASIGASMLMPPFAAFLILTALIGPTLRTVGTGDLALHLVAFAGCLCGVALRPLIGARSRDRDSKSAPANPSVQMKASQ